jgi:muconolactone delta-isomerase
MEFLVQFDLTVPQGTPASEVTDGERAEASAAAELADGPGI